MKYGSIVLLIVCLYLLMAGPLSAQEIEAAQKAYADGIELYEKGAFADAAKAFRAANEIQFNWKILYNIGQCEAAARRNGPALQAFEEYLTRAGDDISVERANEVMAEISRLKQIVGHLEFAAPKGAEIFIDDEKRGTAPMTGPIGISAGVDHDILVVLNGKTLFDRKMRMSGGQEKTIEVKEDTTADAATPATTDATDDATPSPAVSPDTGDTADKPMDTPPTSISSQRGHRLKVAGIVSLATGVGLVTGGLVIGAAGLSKAKKLNSKYDGEVEPSNYGAYDTAMIMANVANVLVGVGAAAAVTGVVLLVVHKRKTESPGVKVAPVVGNQSAGVVIGGTF